MPPLLTSSLPPILVDCSLHNLRAGTVILHNRYPDMAFPVNLFLAALPQFLTFSYRKGAKAQRTAFFF